MNTIIIWDECGESPVTFIVLEGDYSHLNNKYINSAEADSEELYELMYNVDGEFNQIQFDAFPLECVNKDTKVIVCGFIP